jgi:hypothetical protein
MLLPVREVLPATAALVAAVAMALLVFRSPLRLGILALILFGAAGLFEYAVSARNYGVSLIFLFLIASLYPARRDRGIWIGALVALLCNTNVPAVFLGGSVMLFWLVELLGEDGLRWTPRWRRFALNAAVAAIGALVAFVTVYPPVNDAATGEKAPHGAAQFVQFLFDPAHTFPSLMPELLAGDALFAALLPLLILGSIIGLARRPAPFLAALAAFLVLDLFFICIYPGQYRHEALLLFFLAAMYWLAAKDRGGRWPESWRFAQRLGALPRAGEACFILLLALQLPHSAELALTDSIGIPQGRARDLARLLARDRLDNAIVIAQPDYLLDTLPYYVSNPLFFTRQREFGRIASFSKSARVDQDMDQLLGQALALQARYRRPVVILIQRDIGPGSPPTHTDLGYPGTFGTTPAQVRRFRAAAHRIGVLQPAVSDETYVVYLLNPQAKPSA